MYSPRLSKAATTFRSESSSTGRTTCLESDKVSRTGADFMGHTSTLSLKNKHSFLLVQIAMNIALTYQDKLNWQNPIMWHFTWHIWPIAEPQNTSGIISTERCYQVTYMSLGWHCSFRMGEGKRNLWSQSPVRTSHCETMLSVEALTSLWPSRLQLHTHKQIACFHH